MLPRNKVSELFNWIQEFAAETSFGCTEWDIVRDKIEDALDDAYGCGECDERRRVIDYTRECRMAVAQNRREFEDRKRTGTTVVHTLEQFAEDILTGQHDVPQQPGPRTVATG